jgi:hypothetical protein
MDYFVGVDLGSHVDFSAVSVLARSLAIGRDGRPARDSKGDQLFDWRLRALMRFPLRTPYPTIAEKIARIALKPELRAPRVMVDESGVGVAVLEMIRTALLGRPDVQVWGMMITAGESWRVVRKHEMNVSKVQLVGAFAAVLHSGRFRVCRKPDGRPIDGADVLEKELAAFKVHQSKRSDSELFGADAGKHDDCVACVSLPVFAGGLRIMQMSEVLDQDARFRARERAALDSEARAIVEAEEDAMSLELGVLTPRLALRRARLDHLAATDPMHDELWTTDGDDDLADDEE